MAASFICTAMAASAAPWSPQTFAAPIPTPNHRPPNGTWLAAAAARVLSPVPRQFAASPMMILTRRVKHSLDVTVRRHRSEFSEIQVLLPHWQSNIRNVRPVRDSSVLVTNLGCLPHLWQRGKIGIARSWFSTPVRFRARHQEPGALIRLRTKLVNLGLEISRLLDQGRRDVRVADRFSELEKRCA